MAAKKGSTDKVVPIEDYEHPAAKRTNNPPAGLAHLDRDETPTRNLAYDPRIDPALHWSGKIEHSALEIPAPSIHVHEELSAQAIVGTVRNQRLQMPLFDVAALEPAQAVEFYQHNMDWSNRMILGDSLVVMTSLVQRERLAGQVQCIYMDPPYGIKYQSNFQPRISDTEVRDGRDDDLTREPEMIQAYRDTWELGVHSYLTYLRDRMTLSRELLSESGSLFLQISEENVHRVRILLDEVFGSENFVSQISYSTTSGFAQSKALGRAGDYVLWYAKDASKVKVRNLWRWNPERSGYRFLELSDGTRRAMTKEELDGTHELPKDSRVFRLSDATSQGSPANPQPFEFEGRTFIPARNSHWKANYPLGMERLKEARRLMVSGNTLSYVRYADDFGYQPFTNMWEDTGIAGYASDKRYVVQTSAKVIERCILLASDPGDLVLDPTCGSGTTAVVCEQWGRRWITIDTSRVSLAIARERLLTSTFPFYQLRDSLLNVDGGFVYEEVQRVTLGSIANEEQPETVTLFDRPKVVPKRVRVSGPFTVEALSRYAVNPDDESPSAVSAEADASSHVETLLSALRTQGIPRPGSKPLTIESISSVATAGSLQGEGIVNLGGKQVRFAVSLGPRFGAITMAQVSDALQEAIGYGLVVFAGFAVSSDAQAQLSTGRVGGVDVALLLANPDLLVGNLLKATKSSQTFRLYASPDVTIKRVDDGNLKIEVLGVDSYDAVSGEVTSMGKFGIQSWFLDACFDGKVFRVSQAFFPVSQAWERLARTLRGTVDFDLVQQLHSWESLPFEQPETGRIAVRVISNDGNASEVVVDVSPGVVIK